MGKLSIVGMNILELLWLADKPVHLKDISKEVNLGTRSVNMHLINLRKSGYVRALGGGLYTLTDLGREALGFPKMNKNLVMKILSDLPNGMAFHFYREVNKPLGISSKNLIDFCERIREIDPETFKFHFLRGDFERWIKFLGDLELAKRLEILREKQHFSENKKNEVYAVIKRRCEDLQRMLLQN